jgi:hypothetical protein
MTDEHIKDQAALYALGLLDESERASLEAHLRVCSRCTRLVGAAERDVALLASTEIQREAPPELAARVERTLHGPAPQAIARPRIRSFWPLGVAVAAAFLLGLLPSAYFWNQSRAMHGAMLAQNAVMDRVANAPHRTAMFRDVNGQPAAKVMYAPDGSWYVILIRDASKTLQVAWMHDGRHTMLGNAIPRGDLAMLYLPESHRMDQLALMDGPRVVAEARLSYQ